jgi:hypothetical protein
MRDFFINSFEILVGVIIVLMGLGVVIFAGMAAFGGANMGPGAPNGLLAGLLILIGGGLYVIFIGGLMYLGLGIYQNTKRTAAAVEKLAAR